MCITRTQYNILQKQLVAACLFCHVDIIVRTALELCLPKTIRAFMMLSYCRAMLSLLCNYQTFVGHLHVLHTVYCDVAARQCAWLAGGMRCCSVCL